ncbi:hypothetical protein C4D60_Mb06t37300 [Musa balbisiana]|uniref:(S)-ureidoglycine aminohydrolase cupin domain-containing protein n=1 Tax=Musa balbisiana TaxID=52838 RepID=A0A4S8ITG0_MUSBA|nr:hypothetical protein C4D60_Mb06t37300 [Musa balbisiana]
MAPPMSGLGICLLQMLQPRKFSTDRLALLFYVTTSPATSSFMATSSTGDAPPQTDAANLTIVVERDPPKWRLLELGIRSWPKWGCSPGRYLLRFDAQETCCLLKGKVKPYNEGSSQCVEFGAGDLVVIPKGVRST